MLIADSHEFIELYRGDRDLRLGQEMVRLRSDVHYISLAPDSVSPAEQSLFSTKKLSASDIPSLPERMEVRLLPSRSLRFARKEAGGILSLMPGYARELASIRPDVIFENPYTWLTPRNYATDRVARRLRVPVVYCDPGDGVPVSVRQRILLPFERPVVLRASAIITYNQVGKQRFMEKYGYPAERIHVIPKPVEVGRWRCPEHRAEARRELGIADDRFVVAHLGRLIRLRGSTVLAEVARRALDDPRLAKATFLFIGGTLGSPEDIEQFQHPNTLVTGMVDNACVPAMLAAADVAVFPDLVSRPGFTTAVAESMAAGIPLVVGYDPAQGAVPLEPGVTCERVEPASAEDIVEALARLINEPDHRRALGEAVGRYAAEHMDYPHVASVYLELLEEVIARGRT